MKYYIGYYNKPWDKSEFTVICGCPDRAAALFLLRQYREKANDPDGYVMLTAAEIMDKTLVF